MKGAAPEIRERDVHTVRTPRLGGLAMYAGMLAGLFVAGRLEHLGPKACLLAWLPIVGDPLCAVAGWLKLPFWPCLAYMAIGKFARYLTMTAALLGVFGA